MTADLDGSPAPGPARAPAASRRWPALLLALGCLLSLAYSAAGAFHLDVEQQGGLLWDLDYYRAAAQRWNAGLDPYLHDGAQTGYYYSLLATPPLARVFDDFRAERLYFTIALVALGAALALVVRAVRAESLFLCWLAALAFGNGDVLYALASGNLSWLVGLLQAAAILAAARGRWRLFYLLLGLASLIKPYSLLLLVLPLTLGRLRASAALALVPLAVDAAVGWIAYPHLVASRSEAIWLGVIEPLQLRYTLTGRLSRILVDLGIDAGPATLAAFLLQTAVAAALVLALRSGPPPTPRRAFALGLVAAFAMLPRMAGYDAFLFGPALFVAFFDSRRPHATRTSTVAGVLALLAGLLKEGLALVPILALVSVLSRRRGTGGAGA